MQRPDNGLPEDIREHMRLMCDIIALGFQTDKTRVATLLLSRDLSGALLSVPGREQAASRRLSLRHRPRTIKRSYAFTSASSPTWRNVWTQCQKGRAPCWTIAA